MHTPHTGTKSMVLDAILFASSIVVEMASYSIEQWVALIGQLLILATGAMRFYELVKKRKAVKATKPRQAA